jgi:hypothetical protein
VKPTVPRAQLSKVLPTLSIRLVPIQILPAATPPEMPGFNAPERHRVELPRNAIPANSAKGSAVGETSQDLGEFFLEMLRGPRK